MGNEGTCRREAGFSDAKEFEIAAVAAGHAIFAKVLDAKGASRIFLAGPDAVLRPLPSEGRPIDTAATLAMAQAGVPA